MGCGTQRGSDQLAHARARGRYIIEKSGAAVVINGPEYEGELRASLAPSAAGLN